MEGGCKVSKHPVVRDQGSIVDAWKIVACLSWPWIVLINEIGGFGQNPLIMKIRFVL